MSTEPSSSAFKPSSDFEESVRVDREYSRGAEEQLTLLRNYHITGSAAAYLEDLFARIVGKARGKRKGSNHWLYGYYGSGKSHLLAVTGQLLNSKWVESVGRDTAWSALVGDRQDEMNDLRSLWEECLDTYFLHPLLINLLKEQGGRRRGFGSVILRHLHETQDRSPHLPVAFFEQWYLKRHDRSTLEEKASKVLNQAGVRFDDDDVWPRVQRYPVLAEGVLPELFEEETGVRDGLSDVIDRNLKADVVVEQLEAARRDIEKGCGRDTRVLLLLDEITLFIGTTYGLLTELNALAESIDEVGGGRILTIGTAQEDPSRVQKEYAAREVDFSILDDRFPHQYSLPSSHVGDIVRNRLLRKTEPQRKAFEEALATASLDPETSLVFRDVKQNTDPALDSIDPEAVVDHLPLLPHQPPLFLEILANLRNQKADQAKSIFSGTARAVLAIVHGLLERWAAPEAEPGGTGGDPKRTISLVDFFEVVRPELEDIIEQEVTTIAEVESKVRDGELQPIDASVCKVVLLLQYVPDMIPLEGESNIAVALMNDLDGSSRHQQANAVEESLARLSTYIRRDEANGSAFRFTTREEQAVLAEAEQMAASLDQEDIARELVAQTETFETSTSLWEQICMQLDLPARVSYVEGSDSYPVGYTFDIDQHEVGASLGASNGLNVVVHVEGLLSDEERPAAQHTEAFLWKLGEDGRNALREELKNWAALSAACREHYAPPSVKRMLQRTGEKLPVRIADLIEDGELSFRTHDITGMDAGVTKYVRVSYPKHFHPEMLRVDQDRLREIDGDRTSDELPGWAEKIEVLCDTRVSLRGNSIATKVWSTVGKKLNRVKSLSVEDAIKELERKENRYEGTAPALVAILWGLCQRGEFQAVSETGEVLSADRILDARHWHEIRVREGQGESLRELLEDHDIITPEETTDDGVVRLQERLQQRKQRAATLKDEVEVMATDMVVTKPVQQLLNAFAAWVGRAEERCTQFLDKMKDAQPDWQTIVQEAKNEEVRSGKDRWDRRQADILHHDALLSLHKNASGVLGAQVSEAIERLREQVETAHDIPWWTSEGWNQYVDAVGSSAEALRHLRAWWTRVTKEGPQAELLDRLDGHPWMVAPTDLPLVGQQFQKEYLDGLRAVLESVERSKKLIQPLMRDPHDLDASEIRRTLGRLHNKVTPVTLSAEEAKEHLQRLDALEAITGGRAPGDVRGVGVWPTDRGELDDALRRLADEGGDIAFDDHSHGVTLTLNI